MHSRSLVVIAAVVAFGLSGCKDGSGPDADPTPAASTATSAATTDGTTDGTASPDPTVAPASGHPIDRGVFTYHLPAEVEWMLRRSGLSASYADAELNRWRIVENDNTAGSSSPRTVDAAAELSLSNTVGYDPPLERGENRVVNGVEGWTAQTVDKAFGDLVYVWGAYYEDTFLDLTFTGPDKDPRTREWIEAVLASVEWK